MTRILRLLVVAPLLLAFPHPVSARERAGNIVKNGGFDEIRPNSLPEQWDGGDPGLAKIVEEDGNHFLRIQHATTASTVITQQHSVDELWTTIHVSVRIRARSVRKGAEGWNSGNLQYIFQNAAGEHIGGWDKRLIERDQDWTVMTDEVQIPGGAVRFDVQCNAFSCAGTFDFDDIVVEVVRAGALPPGERTGWGEEPVEKLTERRGRICLNGIWKFMPASGPSAETPTGMYGYIRVPGTWKTVESLPGMVVRGIGEAWKDFDGETLSRAWYERTIEIPKEWDGRAIVLELARVSTDARIVVDDVDCGAIEWPYGEVDITKAVRGKRKAILRVLVVAVQNAAEVLNAMGVGQNTTVKASLASRGIIGEVFLHSRPEGPRVSDVFVQTSVRYRELALEIELSDIARAGPATFVARVLDGDGAEVKRFTGEQFVWARNVQTVSLTWPWKDAKLWDFQQPNLYTLELGVRGAGLDDTYAQTFGFREFWVEGRKCFLNGTEFRMRPTSSFGEGTWGQNNGTVAGADAAYDGLASAGFNVFEMWPGDHDSRGTYTFRELLCERADLKGFPVIAPALSAGEYIFTWREPNWTQPGVKDRWEKRMAAELRRYRNHPSVLFWATTANCFGHGEDQDPRRMGRSLSDAVWNDGGESWRDHMDRGQEVGAAIKKHDPTRPVMFHQGGPIGDIYALNNYLCMIPLQEREEWLSDWATGGDMPYMAVEFGTPLHVTMNRGRQGFGPAQASEPWMTEFCAIYLGNEAYRKEPPAYRSQIVSRFLKDQDYRGWQNNESLEHSWAFQEIERLFITNTWRSWRTIGLTGGLVPWSDGHGWGARDNTPVEIGPATPGMRGAYRHALPKHVMKIFQPEGMELLPAGEALTASNGSTLAWICAPPQLGDAAAFTAKDHSFTAGTRIEKSIALLNDTRAPVRYSVRWEARIGERTISFGNDGGMLAVGETKFVKLAFSTPRTIAGEKVDGDIKLAARVGSTSQADRFAFRLFAPPRATARERLRVSVVDRTGTTKELLDALGMIPRDWDGQDAPLLAIGRDELENIASMPADLETYVARGGRLLVFAQSPSWLRTYTGLRVAESISRRIFPVDASHPVVAGLDAEDLRDWTGAGTHIEPRPRYGPEIARFNGAPFWGWRWGTRGSVASAPIEKPHRSGWRPIIECEFDMAYSPLMELDVGRGRIFLCTLDFDGRMDVDPAATRLASQIVEYAAQCRLAPRAKTAVYIGGDAGAEALDGLGMSYVHATQIDRTAELLVVGPDAATDGLEQYIRDGGKAFVMPRTGEQTAFGAHLEQRNAFGGSLDVPGWHEARGLSPSDLRRRTDGTVHILAGGGRVEAAADGLLGRFAIGRGVAIISQIDPAALDADVKTYSRFTRWRMTRATSQILANLGATFTADRRFLHPEPPGKYRIPLAGMWKARVTLDAGRQTQPGAIKDRGMTDEVRRLLASDVDDRGWTDYAAPAMWEGLSLTDGEAVFRRVIDVPARLAGKNLVLHLGSVDDFDDTYFNGEHIGSTDASTPDFWSHRRVYEIPGRHVKEGRNVLAVRCFDHFGGGGFGAQPHEMLIVVENEEKYLPPSLYHTDHRTDFERGDDPYRYYRW